ncbi:hypothetical protein LGH82_33080 [Mesorhizobium sp. PAMC28654]|uniref:hypothetical protein n=1 Tax=Mesorhizobium sp. PAMC28654 TaxID=2880934 RepID=UPI001D0A8FE2|nr:hypothetical protein [Mesorhizobium sp. PAMC28654]UDL89816.1 hypothetical protein LGH82_33080 [Mesorhizobium sp. PAMC28654]
MSNPLSTLPKQVQMHLTRTESSDVIGGKLGKNRNGSLDWTPAFRIGISELGVDEDGDKITAAYAKEAQAGEARPRTKLSLAAQGALAILHDLGSVGVDRRKWRDACCKDVSKMSAAEDIKTRQTAFRRALQDLLQAELIEVDGPTVSAAGATGDFDDITTDTPFPDDPIET